MDLISLFANQILRILTGDVYYHTNLITFSCVCVVCYTTWELDELVLTFN